MAPNAAHIREFSELFPAGDLGQFVAGQPRGERHVHQRLRQGRLDGRSSTDALDLISGVILYFNTVLD